MEEGLFVPIFSVGCTSHSPASSSLAGGAENLPPHEACGGKFRLSACPHPNVLRQEVHPCRQLLVPAQDGVLGRGTTPPQTPTAPLGGGGQAAMQWAACCPPTGAQVTGESSCPASLSARASLQEGLRAPGWGGASTDAWFGCTNMSCRCPSHACSPERTRCSMSACCSVIVVRRVPL